MVSNPIVHRIAANHPHTGHLAAHSSLQHGVDVREKKVLTLGVGQRDLWLESSEDIQIGRERLSLVKITNVGTGPVKAGARSVLNAIRVNAAFGEDGLVFWCEVFPNDAEDTDVREEARGKGKVCRSSPETVIHRTMWGLDCVERHGTYN